MSRVLTRRSRRMRLAGLGPLFIVSLALGGGVTACSDAEHATQAPAATTVARLDPPPAPAAEPTQPAGPASPAPVAPAAPANPVPLGHMHLPTAAEVESTWAARPGYVTALPGDWQAAYAYALARPDVLQWLPCYCGCGGMGHRSNLDCFFQRREEEGPITYEEHASYCNICVDTANLAARMMADEVPIDQIRAAVDARYRGGAAPGTDTPLPPST